MLRYVAEISPPQWRGPLCTVVQLFITLGLVVGFFVCYGTVRIDSSLSWRLPLAMQSGLAFFLSIASFFYLPQSPRWLAYKGRKEEASRVWDKLGVSSAEREKDLLKDSATPAGAEVVEVPTTQAGAKAKSARERMQKNWAESHGGLSERYAETIVTRSVLDEHAAIERHRWRYLCAVEFGYTFNCSLFTNTSSTHLSSSNKPVSTPQKPPSSPPASQQSASSPSPS